MALLLDPKLWLLILLISVLGTIPLLTCYAVGRRGTRAVMERFPQITEDRWERAHKLYSQHGTGLVLFTAVPMLGIVLSAAAGAFGIRPFSFGAWVLVGRITRNWLTLLLFDQTMQILFGPTIFFQA